MGSTINRFAITIVDYKCNNWRNVIYSCPYKNQNVKDFTCSSLFGNIDKLIDKDMGIYDLISGRYYIIIYGSKSIYTHISIKHNDRSSSASSSLESTSI